MPYFQKKRTPYSTDSDITRSSAEKAAERLARIFRGARLEATVSKSRKSASHYVIAERYDSEEQVTPSDIVSIRVSDHYLPDKYADLEQEVDYQVFTSDIEALAETVRAALKRMGVPEPKGLEQMVRRSRAQKKSREDKILASLIREKINEVRHSIQAGDLSFGKNKALDNVERLAVFGKIPLSKRSFPLAWLDGDRWISMQYRFTNHGRQDIAVSVPATESDTPESIMLRILEAWKSKT